MEKSSQRVHLNQLPFRNVIHALVNKEAKSSFLAASFHEVSGCGAINETSLGCTWNRNRRPLLALGSTLRLAFERNFWISSHCLYFDKENVQ